MSVDAWGTGDILVMLAVAAVVVATVAWWVPAIAKPVKTEYSDAEIREYDRNVISYVIAASVALVVGAVHMVVKNLPGVSTWLWEAGYGGHLVRDLANSHIIIVGCGTVLLSGITWYALPRMIGRPLFSTSLANASLRFTVLGVFGFYLSWVVLGIVEGEMVRDGWTYEAAKKHLGAWHTGPTRLTSMMLGIGYWTFVLNVCLTAMMARAVRSKPFGYYARFIVVAALALLVGTVQGVLQVLPAAADWIHAAGKFGNYVDPISHAHINLVTGMVVALGGLLVFFSGRIGRPIGLPEAKQLYRTLVPASLAFYLAFLLIGLVRGGAVVGHGGIQSTWLYRIFTDHQGLILATIGSLMLASFWIYIRTVWDVVAPSSFGQLHKGGSAGALWLASTFALAIGTFQGLLQTIPDVQERLIWVEEIPNAHAQLNMIGGVLLALIGLTVVIVPGLTGKELPAVAVRRTLTGVGGGITGVWAVTVVAGLLRANGLDRGQTNAESWSGLGLLPPVLLTLSSGAVLWGAWAFARAVWVISAEHRARVAVRRRTRPERVAGAMPSPVRKLGGLRAVALEFVGGLLGWPGAGWLATGRVIVGVPLLMIGPMMAWAVLPLMFSPLTGSFLSGVGWAMLLVWLPVTATLSSAALALAMLRRHRTAAALQAESDAARNRGRLQKVLIGTGTGLMIITLASALVIPAVIGTAEPRNVERLQPWIPDGIHGVYAHIDASSIVGGRSGFVPLYEWSFLLDEVPAETPAVYAAELAAIVVAERGVVESERYHLFAVPSGVEVDVSATGGTAGEPLVLSPKAALAAGAYLIDIPNAGGYGRSYYYIVVSEAV